MKTVLGLDIGTTSAKAVLFNTSGKLIFETEELIETIHPETGWAEQSPDNILMKAITVLNAAVTESVKGNHQLLAIGLSTAMHSLICVDKDKTPLSNAIIFSDGRSMEQAKVLNETIGKDVYSRTGTPIHPMSPFVKLKWMQEMEYQPFKQAAYFMSIKEYLVWKWFDQRLVDYACASATGFYDVTNQCWDRVALNHLGVHKDQLSTVVAPDTKLTNLSSEIAQIIGLPKDVTFIIGSADGQLANLGDGAIDHGETAISVGTSGAIRQFTTGAPIDPNGETFTYAFTEDSSIIGGPTNNGGIALQWLKDLLEFEGSHPALIDRAKDIPAGSGGLLFLPYVNGERAPIWNQAAKGTFHGLSIGHQKGHLVKAVLEGIALNLFQIGQSLEKLAGPPTKITVNSGLSKSEIWVQILADIFGKDIHLSESHHSAAWGAAWTALVGIGFREDYSSIKEWSKHSKVIQPNMETHQKYQEIYQRYLTLGNQMKTLYES